MSELNFFDLETSKSKVRVKRDALPEAPLIVNSEGQNPIAHEAHLQELDNLQQEADGLQHGLEDAAPPVPDALPEQGNDSSSDDESEEGSNDSSSDDDSEEGSSEGSEDGWEEPNPDELEWRGPHLNEIDRRTPDQPPSYEDAISKPPSYEHATSSPPSYEHATSNPPSYNKEASQKLEKSEDLGGQEGAAGIDNEPSCMSGEGSMCSKGEMEGESEEIESEFQSEEMEGEFQEAEAAMEEAGSVTTEIEASAMKITTELETEGVMLEEEAAAGPPGWIADAVTFVVFSCQIYDIAN